MPSIFLRFVATSEPGFGVMMIDALVGFWSAENSSVFGTTRVTLTLSTSSSAMMCCSSCFVMARCRFTSRSKSVVVQRSMSKRAHGSVPFGMRFSSLRITRTRRAVCSSAT